MMSLGRILTMEIHKTPDKTLVGDDHNSMARPLPGHRQGPCRGHPRGHSQALARLDATIVPMQLPARQLGRCLHVNRRPQGQLDDAYVVA